MSDSGLELQYEEQLRTCRDLGHDFIVLVGRVNEERLICERCGAVFREEDE